MNSTLKSKEKLIHLKKFKSNNSNFIYWHILLNVNNLKMNSWEKHNQYWWHDLFMKMCLRLFVNNSKCSNRNVYSVRNIGSAHSDHWICLNVNTHWICIARSRENDSLLDKLLECSNLIQDDFIAKQTKQSTITDYFTQKI